MIKVNGSGFAITDKTTGNYLNYINEKFVLSSFVIGYGITYITFETAEKDIHYFRKLFPDQVLSIVPVTIEVTME